MPCKIHFFGTFFDLAGANCRQFAAENQSPSRILHNNLYYRIFIRKNLPLCRPKRFFCSQLQQNQPASDRVSAS